MLQINNMNFADNIMVLYKIKEKRGHKTLQETYKYLETEEIDVILDVLVISYNVANPNNQVTDELHFGQLLADNKIGVAKIATIYKEVVEAIMFSGMDDNEVAQLKNQLANLKKQKK